MAMERENSRRRTRRKPSSPLKSFWYQKGRRYCAMLLSFCLILGNTAGTAFAAGTGEEDPTFLITRADLYEALQKAAAEGKQPEENLSFQGDEELQKAYQDLLDFDLNADLYELKPEIKQDTKDMELRIFACLDQGVDPEKRYVIAGDEKIIFLVTNKTGQEQEATIQVDKKRTEPISILPGTALIVEDDGPEAAPGGNGAGAGSGGATNQGGGSGSGGGAAEKTESQEAATEKTSEEAASPDDGKGGDSIEPEDSLGDQVEPEDKTENKGDNPSGQEEASRENETPEKENPSKEETKKEDQKEPELEQESGTEAPKVPETDNGKNESDNNKEEIKADDAQNQGKDDSKDAGSTDKGEPEKKEDNADKNDAGQGEPEKKDEASDKGEPEKKDDNADKNDTSQDEPEKKDEASDKGEAEKKDDTSHKSEPEKNEGASDQKESEKKEDSNTEEKVSLSVSLNQVQRVASIWGKKASSANGTSVKKKTASGSNASPSNADQLLEGEAYETILLEKTKLGAAAFVTTASALGLDDDSFKLFTIYENNELKDVTVRVAAEPGDLPDNVTLRVKELEPEGENADQYRDAEEALKNEGAQYDGMMALDISFIDPDGNEVEPRGDVQVSIKVNAERLPEEVNAESLSVQHLKEEADGSVQVNQVADVTDDTDGIVEVNQDEAVAEFSVESFSTFTISWKSGNKEYFKVTVHYVNVFGDEFGTGELSNDSLFQSGTVELENTTDFTLNFQEYSNHANPELEYVGAYYGSYNGEEIDSIQGEKNTERIWISTGWRPWDGYYSNVTYPSKLEFKRGDSVVAKMEQNYNPGQSKTANVYLVYKTPDVVGSPTVDLPSLTRSKKAISNGDGTYDLELSVSAGLGSSSEKAKMDILLIVDKSSSMNNTMTIDGKTKSRKDWVAEAVGQLTTMVGENPAIDARYSIVSFSSRNQTSVNLEWTDAKDCTGSNSLETVINGIEIPEGQGTNYQAGIAKGKVQLERTRYGAKTVVIFLTDGLPTFRNKSVGQSTQGGGDTWNQLNSNSNEDGNGQNDGFGRNIAAAKLEIEGMGCTSFYAIGFGDDFEDTLKTLISGLPTTVKDKDVFSATTVDTLMNTFTDISEKMTSILVDHVSIKDQLSENVQAVLENGQRKQPKVYITGTTKEGEKINLEGNSVKIGSATVSASLNGDILEMKFEPKTYQLQEGLTYKTVLTIEPTAKAYENYWLGGKYPNTAEDDTGTHSLKDGLYSNAEDQAYVSYKYSNDEDGADPQRADFNKPVIQLNVLRIEKTFSGLENLKESERENLKKSLTFKVELKQADKTIRELTYPFSEFTKAEGEGNKYTLDVPVPPGVTYTVTEIGQNVDGYKCVTTESNTKGTIEKGTTETTVGFTNEYSNHFILKVKKVVDGNMAEKDRTFTFQYTVYEKDGENWKKTQKGTLEVKPGDEDKIIHDIPSGAKVVVEEIGADDYSTTYGYKMGDEEKANVASKRFELDPITADTEVVFINHKSISTPTGLSNHKRPYIWMLAMAAIGLMGFSITGLSEKARKVRDEE